MVEFTGARYADSPMVEVETYVDASPERVWDLVRDIHLLPPLSTELQRVEWQGGATEASLGARFTGYNHNDALGEWQSTSTVVECEAPRVFAWAVGNVDEPAATWRFVLEPAGDGTVLRQSARMGPGRSGLNRAIDAMPDKEEKIVFVRLRQYEEGMLANLAHVKAVAEDGG